MSSGTLQMMILHSVGQQDSSGCIGRKVRCDGLTPLQRSLPRGTCAVTAVRPLSGGNIYG